MTMFKGNAGEGMLAYDPHWVVVMILGLCGGGL